MNSAKLILKIFLICLIILPLALFLPVAVSTAKAANEGYVLANDKGEILYSKNPDTLFVPASVLKILTSIAALNHFGFDYRFKTLFYFDENSRNLYVKGLGDPLFITEVIERFSFDVKKNITAKQINHIILDNSYFDESIIIPGTGDSLKSYNAHVGALSANFNTVSFRWDNDKKRFVSPEPLTPLLDIFIDPISKTRMKQGRIILSKEHAVVYPGHLIKHFLKKRKITVSGQIKLDHFDLSHRPVHWFISPFRMSEVLEKILEYSNNFIANQLFLSMGAETFDAPGTLEKGIKSMMNYVNQRIYITGIKISEGSGISRKNKISPRHMINVLLEFTPFVTLLRNDKNDFYKTGTLNGVRARAGYIIGEDNRLYPYAIMINEINKGYESIRRNLIKKVYRISNKK
jgi:serine-type D-Ala-D-Ala carboxypeptidase/endopeptidase (penicillin-binding protein 4)